MKNRKIETIEPVFVMEMPDKIETGKLYISEAYGVAIHLCACGCGEIVVTPIDQENGWELERNGELVSLTPSIGNFQQECKSHYYIKENKIKWC